MEDMEMGDEMEDEGDLDLESIIRELEEDLNEEDMEGEEGAKRNMKEEEDEADAPIEEDIDSICNSLATSLGALSRSGFATLCISSPKVIFCATVIFGQSAQL